MKRITLLLVAAFLITGFSVYSQNVTPGAVVSIHKVVPATEDITNDQFETFYEKFLSAFMREAPTIPICLMKKISGNRMGEYAEFFVYESLDARNEWFPEPGVSTEKTKELLKNLGEVWDEYRIKVSEVDYTNYVALPFSGKSILVKPGNVVFIFECEITLEEGMTTEEFEKFYVEEYGPAFTKHFQDTQFCALKGERGERTGKYTELTVLKSMAEYNKWITADGMLSEQARQAFKNMGKIQERMEKMYMWSRSNTYIVL
ncbi:MAG: hypothetical protein R6W31_19755 [Bacteroidales bacterium]